MSEHFADRLLDAIDRKGSPICVGIDPVYDRLPKVITARTSPSTPVDAVTAVDAIFDFTVKLLRRIAPLVPCVKFQSAYFEKYLHEGVEAYYNLVHEAKELGLVVIGDVKRGDIGSTSDAYASAHLIGDQMDEADEIATPDAITINPMLGMDSIQPFVEAARDFDKGLFVLIRTSNPGSAVTQDVKLADGRSWSEMIADEIATIAGEPGLIGSNGFSAIGAVVGATQPAVMDSLRQRMPRSIFLLPGYGAQGATAQMTRSAFFDGKGALVSASRSVLYAYEHPSVESRDWLSECERAVIGMRDDLANVLQ